MIQSACRQCAYGILITGIGIVYFQCQVLDGQKAFAGNSKNSKTRCIGTAGSTRTGYRKNKNQTEIPPPDSWTVSYGFQNRWFLFLRRRHTDFPCKSFRNNTPAGIKMPRRERHRLSRNDVSQSPFDIVCIQQSRRTVSRGRNDVPAIPIRNDDGCKIGIGCGYR